MKKPLMTKFLANVWLYRLVLCLPILPGNSLWFKLREKVHTARLQARGSGGYLQDTLISYPENVRIGDRVTCGGRVFIDGLGGVTIGNDCMLAYGTSITSATHDTGAEIMNQVTRSEPVTLGNNIWVGIRAIILPGVTIADGTILAAGAVVTQSFLEPNTIIGGVPARVLRQRKV